MGYTNIQADVNFYRQSLNADGIKDVTGPYTSLYEDVFRAITVTTDSVVSVTSYVGDSLSNQFLLAGTEIYGLFSSVTIHSGNAILHLAGASYISEIVNQYSASGIPLGFYEEGTQCLSQKISALLTQGVFDDASWVMVPSQYEEDWVRAFKPTSELGNLAFTRSSDATFTDSTGVVRRSPWNLVTFSEQFDNAAWTKRSATISANVVNAPNGTLTADKIIEAASTGFHSILQSNASRVGVPYTFSVYLKAAERTWALVWFDAESAGAYVNLSTGELGTVSSGVTASVTSVGDGWYRCVISKNIVIGAGVAVYTATSNGGASYVGNGTSGIFAWGAQLAEGTEALPYFATTDRLNVPRLDYSNADGTLSTCPRLLLEPQRTNGIRNSSMVGAVAGSPGTAPTNWGASAAGLTQTIVGTGTENGLPYIDFRFNGVASGTELLISTESINQIAAATAQTWTNSFYLKIIAQPNPPVAIYLNITERTSAGTFVTSGNSSGISVTSSLNRFSFVRTLSGGATVAAVQPRLGVTLTISSTYDFTIRIAAPQMELGAYATTWVPTTTAAVTRIADVASKTGVSSLIGQTEGTLFVDCVPPNGVAGRIFAISDASLNNRIAINYNTNNRIDIIVRTNNVITNGTISASASTQLNPGVINKIAFAYKSDEFALYINGSLAGTVTGVFSVTAALQQIGASELAFLGTQFMQWNQAALFPTRLDNATLAAITTL
jgi:hypothetical protein